MQNLKTFLKSYTTKGKYILLSFNTKVLAWVWEADRSDIIIFIVFPSEATDWHRLSRLDRIEIPPRGISRQMKKRHIAKIRYMFKYI